MRAFLLCLLSLVAACTGALEADLGESSQVQGIQGLPSGFTQRTIASVSEPTAFAFLPDGRMLVTSRSGKVRVIRDGSLLSGSAIDLTGNTCPERERGLLGVAVDPDFSSNRHVYLFYTRKKSHCNLHDQSGNGAVNRVSRFTYDLNTDRLSSEKVIVDHMLSYNGWHNGGDIAFGQDGFLYITVGDWGAKLGQTSTGWSNNNARHKSLLSGKVLRVDKSTGAPAPGNPWLSSSGSRRCGDPNGSARFPANSSEPCQETFAWGFRNPFRIARRPGSNTFFTNDVGQNIGGDWEEVDEVASGADYGWNSNQGSGGGGTTGPIYRYAIGEQVGGRACRSITGGAFVPTGAWPSSYEGAYFFGDYVCGAIFYIKKDGNTWRRTTFATDIGGSSVVHMGFGPGPNGQSLYYTSFSGSVLRIDPPASSNNPPTAVVTASPRAGDLPLRVSFDGSGSFDNDSGDRISRYIWDFGDGRSTETTAATVTHEYTTRGRFTAKLTVEDNRSPRRQASTTIEIQPGNRAPTVTISSPGDGAEFVVGQTLRLRATASDPEDGNLPASALNWSVQRIHDDHTHPFLSQTGDNVALVPEGPEGLAAALTSRYRVTVTVTDSAGLSASDRHVIEPKMVDLTFRTEPAGLSLRVDDGTVVAPDTVTSWEGYTFKIGAPTQTLDGKTYTFRSWSDNGAAEHDRSTPANPATYTATFVEGLFSAKINFQLDSAPVPEGYLEDNGALFGDRGNGLRYGWNQDNQFAARDRDNARSADQRYDTTILFQKMGNKHWEIAVPNGKYDVLVVAGDAQHFDSVYDITAEGRTILSGTPTTSRRWIEARATVTVSDGRLTLNNGPTARNNKICFAEIVQVP
jgi:glucose/arabinose dehydrogenase